MKLFPMDFIGFHLILSCIEKSNFNFFHAFKFCSINKIIKFSKQIFKIMISEFKIVHPSKIVIDEIVPKGFVGFNLMSLISR